MYFAFRFVITLLGSLSSLAIVSGNKKNIVVNKAGESWKSVENLTTLLEVSYNVSKCCNIYVSGKSAATENLFNAFTRIYPYEYVINNRTYDCNGYFMISKSGDDLVSDIINTPMTIATTEILIIVDESVKNSAKLFNVSMYENANVNIAASSGLWTLSENFLKPRVFKRVSRHNEMLQKRDIMNFKGRQLNAAALYSPPFCYLNTMVNRTVNGIKTQFFKAEDESELDGVELKLFMLMAERLNFTWTARTPPPPRYGFSNGTHWNGGLIGFLFRKEVDIAFTNIWLTEDTYHFANLTTPWSDLDVRFLVPRPQPRTSFWALTRPLSFEVWFAVLGILIVQSFCIYMSAWISPRIPKRFQSFAITWTELMGRLLGTCAPKKMQGLEIQFQLWHLFGILVVTAYSSSLEASLTNTKYEERIDTARDFIRKNLTWGGTFTPVFAIMFDETDFYGQQFRRQFQIESNITERHQNILSGNYAMFGTTIDSTFFPQHSVGPEYLKHFRVMKQRLGVHFSPFAVQPWLFESVDKLMHWMKEAGLVDYHVRDVIHRRTSNALREVLVEHDGYVKGARVLRLTPLAAGFFMLIMGLCISTVAFFIELHTFNRKKSIRRVLLDIKRKRQLRRVMELKRSVHRINKKLNRKNIVARIHYKY